MKMKKMMNVLAVVVVILTLAACEKEEIRANENQIHGQAKRGGGKNQTTTFGGQATGLNATVVNTENPVVTSQQTILAQTLMLTTTGGSDSVSHAFANIPGVLTADLLTASINGQVGSTVANSSASNLNITVGGHVITATSLQSTASASCGPLFSGSSRIEGLVIDGTPIVVTGAPNQAVFLPSGGLITINQQSTSKKGGSGSITVIALHILLPYGTDIRIAVSRADIKC